MLPYFMKIYLFFLCWNWLSSETSTITGNIYDLHLYYLTLVKKWPLTFTASLTYINCKHSHKMFLFWYLKSKW